MEQKKQQCDSKSLWNCTLSPGWNKDEVQILKNALLYFGVGKWKKILNSECLPGKGDYMGLQVDIDKIFIDNMRKQGVTRKNNCIINTGDNPNKEERKRRIEANKIIYGFSKEQIIKLKKPRRLKMGVSHFLTVEEIEKKKNKTTTIEIIESLMQLQGELQKRIKLCEQKKTTTYIHSQKLSSQESIIQDKENKQANVQKQILSTDFEKEKQQNILKRKPQTVLKPQKQNKKLKKQSDIDSQITEEDILEDEICESDTSEENIEDHDISSEDEEEEEEQQLALLEAGDEEEEENQDEILDLEEEDPQLLDVDNVILKEQQKVERQQVKIAIGSQFQKKSQIQNQSQGPEEQKQQSRVISPEKTDSTDEKVDKKIENAEEIFQDDSQEEQENVF